MNIKTSEKGMGVIFALVATILWSGNFIIARGISGSVPPATLAFLRWTTACIAVLPFGLAAFRRDWLVIRSYFLYVLITSFLGVTLFNTVLYIAGHTTETLNLSLISMIFPIFVIILSRMVFGEPITLRRIGGIAVALCGIVTLVTRGDLQRLMSMTFAQGDVWMLLASFIFAVYSILVRKKPREISSIGFLTATFLFGLVMLAPWAFLEQLSAPWPEMTLTTVGAVLYIGVLASLVAYFAWNKAVEGLGPSKAGFIYYSLPVFSGVEAYFLLGEPITLLHMFSGVAIIGGILVASRA